MHDQLGRSAITRFLIHTSPSEHLDFFNLRKLDIQSVPFGMFHLGSLAAKSPHLRSLAIKVDGLHDEDEEANAGYTAQQEGYLRDLAGRCRDLQYLVVKVDDGQMGYWAIGPARAINILGSTLPHLHTLTLPTTTPAYIQTAPPDFKFRAG